MTSADSSSIEWRDVPRDLERQWFELFERSREGLDVSGSCPSCGARELHRWFDLDRAEPRKAFGQAWLGRGGEWQWCGSCHIYVHMSALVPAWWDEAPLPVDPDLLRHDPGPIEEARIAAG